MTALLRKLRVLLATLRTGGPGGGARMARYVQEYASWQRAYTRSGEVAGASGAAYDLALIKGEGPAEAVDLICNEGTWRLDFPRTGVARLRFRVGSTGAGWRSYAVHPQGVRMQPPEVADGKGPHMPVHSRGIAVQPDAQGGFSFIGPEGEFMCRQTGGLRWRGERLSCTFSLAPGTHVYGLGEKAFGLDLSGRRLVMWNTDPEGGYAPGSDPLYMSIPFLLMQHAGSACGIFFDNTYRAEFDLGRSDPSLLEYSVEGGDLCYYVIAGPGMADVLRRYSDLTGRMPLPPMWGIGFHQSRWSYSSEAEVRRVAQRMRDAAIPCDAIYLDIDHMRGYRIFTFDSQRFPNAQGMIADLRQAGIRTVCIVDPGVKIDTRYRVYAEGMAQNAFCRLPNGKVFSGPVWPGECAFPDFASARVRRWWQLQHRPLIEAGVAGIWNDMNEPAVFPALTFPNLVQHDSETGRTDHHEIHNVYGMLMCQAAHDAWHHDRPDERPFLVSRAGYAGIQRYALTWTGDNHSSWEHLALSLPMVLNLGLSGQPFAGADVGGFNGDAGGELLARWTQLGCCLPFFRNHSALGTRHQEPYALREPFRSICRRYIELRYRLLPYIYTAFWQASQTGLPVARALALSFPDDEHVAAMNDQFMLGDSLLVAPVLERQRDQRNVYFPAGWWYDFWTGELLEGPGEREVATPLDHLPLYVRSGSVLPLASVRQHTGEPDPNPLALHLFPGNGQSQLYEDDGHSLAYRMGEFRETSFRQALNKSILTLTRTSGGEYSHGYRALDLVLRSASPGQEDALPVAWIDGKRASAWERDDEWGTYRVPVGEFQEVNLDWRRAASSRS